MLVARPAVKVVVSAVKVVKVVVSVVPGVEGTTVVRAGLTVAGAVVEATVEPTAVR